MALMQPVDSASIAAIGYDRRRRRLFVQFRDSGETYAYLGVPPRLFAALEEAPSKGRFVNAVIKDRYPYERVPATSSPTSRRR
jgi:hypothetical protein